MLKILFLASNPSETTRLRLDREFREIEENIKKSEYRDRFKLISKWAVRTKDLLQAVNECNPDIIHFSGHGEECEIVLEGDNKKAVEVSKSAIIRLIGVCKNLKMVLFNICKSELFANEAVSKIDYAVGMKGPIGDNAAIYFAYRFYSSLGFGEGINDSYEQALTEIALHGYDKYIDTPQIFFKDHVNKNAPFINKELIDNYKNNQSSVTINIEENAGQVNIGTGNSRIDAVHNSQNGVEIIKKSRSKDDIKVFLSSTHTDLLDYKKSAYNAITSKDEKYSGLEFVGDLDNELTNIRSDLIKGCKLFIGIYAWKYGFTIDDVSIIEHEYDYAVKKGLTCFCYIIDEYFQWSPKLMEFNKLGKLSEFKSKILDEHKKEFFKDTKHLESNIIQDLNKWFAECSILRNKNDNVNRDIENPIKRYKEIINEKFKRLPMVGFDRVFDMEGVYIPLTLHSKNDSFVKCRMDKKECDEKFIEKTIDAKKLIDLKCNDKAFVVLADPGMGKTTMLKYMTFLSSRKNEKYIPVFIKLSDFCDEDMILEEYLIKSVREFGIGLENEIKESIKNGEILVLLDGLDEVKRTRYNIVTNKICNFICSNVNCRVIITSRINGFKNDQLPYPIFEIDNLPLSEIKIFVEKWFSIDNGLIDAIKANQRILELAYNPFLLSIICLIYEKEKVLPNRRVELYRKCIHTLLILRDDEGVANRNVFSVPLKEKILMNIAYENFTNGKNEFSYNLLYNSISKTMKEFEIKDSCEDRILKEICENSGILHKSDDNYVFLHRTFFEYYVSCKMKENSQELIFKYLISSKWEEPLRLYAAQIDTVIEGTEFIKKVWGKDETLAIRCFPDMDKVIEPELIKKMLSEAGVEERIKLVKELPEKVQDDEKVVDTLRGLFNHETNGEVLYWGIQILKKSSVTDAINIAKEKLDVGADERYKKYVEELMVKIPEGEFMMGSNNSSDNEKPVHRVKLDEFYMSKYLVTNELYERFDPDHKDKRDDNSDSNIQPVIYVNWYEAVVFSRWMGCEIPTEAQWEYACRAETTTEFNTGNTLTKEQANIEYKIGKTTPVGKYKLPNKWGLHDMHGNVIEWCKDWYDEKYYDKCNNMGTVKNPEKTEIGSFRVLRGGGWNFGSGYCRSALRYCLDPVNRSNFIGIRLIFRPSV